MLDEVARKLASLGANRERLRRGESREKVCREIDSLPVSNDLKQAIKRQSGC